MMTCTKKSNLQIKTLFFIQKKTKFKSLKQKKIEINVNKNSNAVVDVYNDYVFFEKNVFMKKNPIVEKIDE